MIIALGALVPVIIWISYVYAAIQKTKVPNYKINTFRLATYPSSVILVGILASLIAVLVNLFIVESGSQVMAMSDWGMSIVLAPSLSIVGAMWIRMNVNSVLVSHQETDIADLLKIQNDILVKNAQDISQKLDTGNKDLVDKNMKLITDALLAGVKKIHDEVDTKINKTLLDKLSNLEKNINRFEQWQTTNATHLETLTKLNKKNIEEWSKGAEGVGKTMQLIAEKSQAIAEAAKVVAEAQEKTGAVMQEVEKITMSGDLENTVYQIANAAKGMEAAAEKLSGVIEQVERALGKQEQTTKILGDTASSIQEINKWQQTHIKGISSSIGAFREVAQLLQTTSERMVKTNELTGKLVAKDSELVRIEQQLGSIMGNKGLFETWLAELNKAVASHTQTQETVREWVETARDLSNGILKMRENVQTLNILQKEDWIKFNDGTRQLLTKTFRELDVLISRWVERSLEDPVKVEVMVKKNVGS
ncbi:MAG: hypothetical protein MK212_13725 [Saprospiraceae bacterium]|nr:hypothetical protein [Saprospiraceae bacterium]